MVEARTYFKRAADGGHATAQYKYAQMCENAVDGPLAQEETAKYYALAKARL